MNAKLSRLSMCRLNPTRPRVPKVPKTRRELERTDILITYMDNNDSHLQINEACLVESDKFVGCTAKFDEEWNVIPLRPDLYPKESSHDPSHANYSVDPKFEERGKSLVLAGQSTCFIGVSPGIDRFGKSINYASGTAFFVGPSTLITAAHIVPDGNRQIVAQYPGARRATSFVDNLFNAANPLHLETFKCKFKATGRPNADITILEVCGTYRAPVHLEVNQVLLTPNDCVDVIGYPGMYNERYVREMHDKPVDGEIVDNVLDLLPKSRLIVTHGPVNSGGMMPTYRLSTVRGMSGSPVILNGKVVGVHVGMNSMSANSCVAFAWEEVTKLLIDHGIIESSLPSTPPNKREPWARRILNGIMPKPINVITDPEEEVTPSQTQTREVVHRLSKSMTSDKPW